jgi:hypothetical protein
VYWTGKVLVDFSTSPVGPPSPLLALFLAYSPALLKMAKVESEPTATRVAGYTSTAFSPLHPEATSTIVAPLEAGELPDVATIRGLRLDQLLFVTIGLLVCIIVGGLASVAWISTKAQFEETSGRFTTQVEGLALYAEACEGFSACEAPYILFGSREVPVPLTVESAP